jgi:hypothetical protein
VFQSESFVGEPQQRELYLHLLPPSKAWLHTNQLTLMFNQAFYSFNTFAQPFTTLTSPLPFLLLGWVFFFFFFQFINFGVKCWVGCETHQKAHFVVQFLFIYLFIGFSQK